MIEFGMNNTLLTFRGQYFEHRGNRGGDDQDRCLTIGGYKSAWLADLVVAYITENMRTLFKEAKLFGIYQDDGLVFHDSRLTTEEIREWLEKIRRNQTNLVAIKTQSSLQTFDNQQTVTMNKQRKYHQQAQSNTVNSSRT